MRARIRLAHGSSQCINAMTKRVSCQLKSETCDVLMKAHITSLDDEAYASSDVDFVVKKYCGFLSACAQATERLSKDLVAASVCRVFNCNKHVGNQFGQAMKEAISYCHTKGVKATSGVKLTEHVKSVVMCFPSLQGTLRLAKLRDGSPADPKKSYPTKLVEYADDGVEFVKSDAASSSGLMSEAEVMAIYGAPPEKKPRMTVPEKDIEVLSSDDNVSDMGLLDDDPASPPQKVAE